MNGSVIYLYEGYQHKLIAITQYFMDWTQSSDGSTIQYLSGLKTNIHENWLHCVTNFKHEYWIFQIWYVLRSDQSTLIQLENKDIIYSLKAVT